MKLWFGFKRGHGPTERSVLFKESLDNMSVLEDRLAKLGTNFFHGNDNPGMLDYFLWPWFERVDLFGRVFPGENLEFSAQAKYSKLLAWMERMSEEPTVAPYLLDVDTHAAFVASVQTGKPDYDYMLNK